MHKHFLRLLAAAVLVSGAVAACSDSEPTSIIAPNEATVNKDSTYIQSTTSSDSLCRGGVFVGSGARTCQ